LEANHLKRLLANKHFSYSLVTCSLELVERRRPRTAEGCPREEERWAKREFRHFQQTPSFLRVHIVIYHVNKNVFDIIGLFL
jgi:hypothetical protein